MKWALIGGLLCINALAATDYEDGSLMLSPDEVKDTRALFAEWRWKLQEQQSKIHELEKQVEFYKTSRCL